MTSPESSLSLGSRQTKLSRLLQHLRQTLPPQFELTSLTFAFHHSADSLSVICEPAARFTDPLSSSAGIITYGLLQQKPVHSTSRDFPPEDLLTLTETELNVIMLREAQAWYARTEQQRINRDAAWTRSPVSRVQSANLLRLSALTVLLTVLCLLAVNTSALVTLLYLSATLFVTIDFLDPHRTRQFAHVRLNVLQPPMPVTPARTLELRADKTWHAQIVPLTPATTPELHPAAAGSIQEQVQRRSLQRSREILERSRAQLTDLQQQATPEDAAAISALLDRAADALAIIDRRERHQDLHLHISDAAHAIETELNYLGALDDPP